MKRIISVILILTLALSLVPAAFAASDEANEAAQSLYELGLFNGTGTDADGSPIFDLDRAPTRHEAVTMLVRLLGKGEEAENGTWDTPFTDVADWAAPYVGYAYANGLTSGTSETTYSGDETVTASQYITFVLRALGYSSGTDFRQDKAWELSDSLGITSGQYNASTTGFTRGDVAIISNCALNTEMKEGNVTLLSMLDISVPTSSASSNETKVAILEAYINGATAMRDAFLRMAGGLSSVSSNSSYAAYQLKTIGDTFQKNVQSALDCFEEAVEQCGNYSDTQNVKQNMEKLVNIYSDMVNYTVTEENALEFIRM